MKAPTRSRVPRRSGTAAVELAFVAPLLVLLLTGLWEVGRMIEVNQVMSNAAREGARRASTGNQSVSTVTTAVKNYLSNNGINTTGCVVHVYNLATTPNPTPSSPDDDPTLASQLDHLRVTVTLPFNNVKWIFLNQITSTSTLSAASDWFSMKDKPLTVDPAMPIN